MADNPFQMPRDSRVVGPGGRLVRPFLHYLGGIEKLSERQAAYVDPNTASVADVVNALIAAGLMKPE